MNDIIRHIHEQMKPDEQTRRALIQQIRHGRLEKTHGSPRVVSGTIAAAMMFFIAAGGVLLSVSRGSLERSGTTRTETTSAASAPVFIAQEDGERENISLHFNKSFRSTQPGDVSPDMPTDPPDDGIKSRILAANPEINFGGLTYTLTDTENYVTNAFVGMYLMAGEADYYGDKYGALLASSAYDSKQHVLLVGFGDNKYYRYENIDYDYSDLDLSNVVFVGLIGESDNDLIGQEQYKMSGQQIDEVMPHLLEQPAGGTMYISNTDGTVPLNSEYVYYGHGLPREEFEQGSCGIGFMHMYISYYSWSASGKLYRSKSDGNILMLVIEGEEGTYDIEFAPSSYIKAVLYDLNYEQESYKNIVCTHELLQESEEFDELYQTLYKIKDLIADEKYSIDNLDGDQMFDYALDIDGMKYVFDYRSPDEGANLITGYPNSDGSYLDSEWNYYRIPNETADELGTIAEKFLKPYRSYGIYHYDNSGERIDFVPEKTIDTREEYTRIFKLFEDIKSKAPAENGVKKYRPDYSGTFPVGEDVLEIRRGDGKKGYTSVVSAALSPDNMGRLTYDDGTEYDFNLVMDGDAYLVEQDIMDELAEMIGYTPGEVSEDSSSAEHWAEQPHNDPADIPEKHVDSAWIVIGKIYDSPEEYMRPAVALEISEEERAETIAALPDITIDGTVYHTAEEQPGTFDVNYMDRVTPIGEVIVYVDFDSGEQHRYSSYIYKYKDESKQDLLLLDIGDGSGIFFTK